MSKIETGRRLARAKVGRAKHRALEALGRPPVVVFSASKTGSSTAWASLRRSHLRRPVYHLHRIDREVEEQAKANVAAGQRAGLSADDLRAIARLRHQLAHDDVSFTLVTMVREPIGRALSSIFQRHDATGIDMTSATPTPEAVASTVAVVHDMLPTLIEANDAWFDHLIADFDHDVFEQAFDPAVGHARYQGPRFTQSVIRLDRFDEVYRDALGPLFDRPIGPIVRTNEAETKAYAAHRQAVLDALELTDDEVELAASSRVLHHFFTAAEREALIRSWRSGT